jgi:hypothetical protein
VNSSADLNTKAAFRSLARLEALVRFVMDPVGDETNWLEWKCGIDPLKAEGRFAIARTILGFANRLPDRAALNAEGCAFMILGAEPGKLPGQLSIDPSTIEQGLRSYLGTDGPQWQPQNVPIDGVNVIVLTIEPPKWGDPIHTLRKEFQNQGVGGNDGAVFVRRGSSTCLASSAELTALQMRLLRKVADPVALVVESIGEPLIRSKFDRTTFERWSVDERQRLLGPLEAQSRNRVAPNPSLGLPINGSSVAAADAARSLASFMTTPEDRTPEQYLEEVEQYLNAAESAAVNVAFSSIKSRKSAPLRVRALNPTERNLDSVAVTIRFSGVVAARNLSDATLPEPPRIWGPRPYDWMPGFRANFAGAQYPLAELSPMFSGMAPRRPDYTAKADGKDTIISFDPFDLRPFASYELPPVHLIVGERIKDSMTGTWSGTTKNRDGRAEGTVHVQLADTLMLVSGV